jgi:ABC-type Na+ efflux pump permease subunit
MPIRKQSMPAANTDGISESVKNNAEHLNPELENDSLKEQVAQYLTSSSPKQSQRSEQQSDLKTKTTTLLHSIIN